MAKKFICVEAGDRLTKVAICLGTEKSRKVQSAFFYPTPDGTVRDGAIMDASEFALALKTQVVLNKCEDAKEILFAVSSAKIATSEVSMPVITDQKIASVVEMNKSDYFSLELEKYKVLFRVLYRNKKKGEQKSNVLVMAMPLEMLTACASVANVLKLRLKGVDAICSSFADGVRVLKQSLVTAFVNVDCTTTNVIFMRGTEMLGQRNMSLGGEDIIEGYRESCEEEISYLDALGHLTSLSAEDYLRDKLTEQNVRDLLEDVVGGIQRTIDTFQNTREIEVKQTVLMGPCAELLGLDFMVGEATDVRTQQVAKLPSAMQLKRISEESSYYIPSMYVGLSGVNFAKDLMSKGKGKRSKGAMEIDTPTAALLFILLAVFAVYWGYSASLEHSNMEKELAKLDSEIEAMKYLDIMSATHASYNTSRDSLLGFTKLTENPNEDFVQFLAEFEAKMPSEILVASASCTISTINMNITVDSLESAARVVAKLRTFESIAVIQISGLALNTIPAAAIPGMTEDVEEVSFSVVCNYGTNPYTSGFHPYGNDLGILNAPTVTE